MDDLCIIVPARAGSVRLPRKNKRNFFGKPLFLWTLDFIDECGLRSRTIVSTDDREIASAAQERGFDVPWIRPTEISRSQTTSSDVVAHALSNSMRRFSKDGVVALLQVTTPIRQVSTFFELLALAGKPGEVGAVSVKEVPDGSFFTDQENRLWSQKEVVVPKRIRLDPTGAFYFRRIEDFLQRQELIQGARIVQESNELFAIDIDTQEQWERAESLVQDHYLGL